MTSSRGFREIEPTAADEEAAEEILESIEEVLERVHPARVMSVSYTHLRAHET